MLVEGSEETGVAEDSESLVALQGSNHFTMTLPSSLPGGK